MPAADIPEDPGGLVVEGGTMVLAAYLRLDLADQLQRFIDGVQRLVVAAAAVVKVCGDRQIKDLVPEGAQFRRRVTQRGERVRGFPEALSVDQRVGAGAARLVIL